MCAVFGPTGWWAQRGPVYQRTRARESPLSVDSVQRFRSLISCANWAPQPDSEMSH